MTVTWEATELGQSTAHRNRATQGTEQGFEDQRQTCFEIMNNYKDAVQCNRLASLIQNISRDQANKVTMNDTVVQAPL